MAQRDARLEAEAALQKRRSAYDLLLEQFNSYGLGSLVEGIKGLVQENVSPSEFAIRLRQTDAYQKRFAANKARIASGLRALSEGEYIALEDQYQNIMRNYGLPATYYTRGALVSMIYNRGNKLEGDRRKEMRAIVDLVAKADYEEDD